MRLYFCYSESLFFSVSLLLCIPLWPFSLFAQFCITSSRSRVVWRYCNRRPDWVGLRRGRPLLLLDPSPSRTRRQTGAYEPPHRPNAPPQPTSPPVISDRPSFAFIQRLIRASKWSGSSPSRGVRRSARLPKMTGIQKLLTQGAFASHNWLLHSVCLSRAISVRP